MTDLTIPCRRQRGHAHDVERRNTFDFLNTHDTDDGFPVEKLPTLDDGPDAGSRPRPDPPRGRRSGPARRPRSDRVRAHATSSASTRCARPSARSRTRSPSTGRRAGRALDEVNRALHARQVIELDGRARRRQRRPPPRRRPGRRRAGPPVRGARHRADRRSAGAHPHLRQRHCRWIFYDTSRTGRRRWCDMATCGNRAKQARHRAPREDRIA